MSHAYTTHKIGQLARRIRKYATLLERGASRRDRRVRVAGRSLRKAIERVNPTSLSPGLRAGLSAIAVVGAAGAVAAQGFAPPRESPFGFSCAVDGIIAPDFADLDGDGDLDAVGTSLDTFGLAFAENVGSVSEPSFAARRRNPFGIRRTTTDEEAIITPVLADFDDDSDVDILLVTESEAAGDDADYNYFTQLELLENIGTPTAPAFDFAVVVTTAQPPLPDGLYLFPASGDLDGDGDVDLVFQSYEGSGLRYLENTTAEDGELSFGSLDTAAFGLVDTAYYEFPTLADFDADGDGDLDLYAFRYGENGQTGEGSSTCRYYENLEVASGTAETAPATVVASPNPTRGTLHFPLDPQSGTLTVFDRVGRVVGERAFSPAYDAQDLATGMYQVQIRLADGERYAARFVRE